MKTGFEPASRGPPVPFQDPTMTTTATRSRAIAAVFAAACGLISATSVRAAESFDNCTGFIDSLPATITTQGVWCLRKNLTTAMASGVAITVAGHNITIDCNDYKIGGLAAGPSSQAYGVEVDERQNATIRRCGVRGFLRGIVASGSGHLVEDNRLDGNLFVGIDIHGESNLVQRNRVLDTGGSTFPGTIAMYGSADFLDNVVEGVFVDVANASGIALHATGNAITIRGNRVRDVDANGSGYPRGIYASGVAVVIEGNQVTTFHANQGRAVFAPAVATVCRDNLVHGFMIAYDGCDSSFDNVPASP